MKRLYKIEEGKIICGVCGGIAEYFNVDPSLVRLIAVGASLFSAGAVIIVYIVAACILPGKNSMGA